MTSTCIFGKHFDVDYAISCQRGGFIYRRHDELKELIVYIAVDLYHDVEIAPNLLSMNGESLYHSANQQSDARLDINIRGFWHRSQKSEKCFSKRKGKWSTSTLPSLIVGGVNYQIFNFFLPTSIY